MVGFIVRGQDQGNCQLPQGFWVSRSKFPFCTRGPHWLVNNPLLLVPRLGVGAWESLKAAERPFPKGWFILRGQPPWPCMSHREIWERNPPTPNSYKPPFQHLPTLTKSQVVEMVARQGVSAKEQRGMESGGWVLNALQSCSALALHRCPLSAHLSANLTASWARLLKPFGPT
jgi:hypothetical protein